MGNRGRPTLPTQIKRIKGTLRPCRVNPYEPKGIIPNKVPGPPRHLCVRGKEVWKRVAPVLHRNGLLTNLDLHALEALCVCGAHVQEANEIIKKEGAVITVIDSLKRKVQRIHPAVKVAEESERKLLFMFREFGMTPASRASMQLDIKE